MEGGAEWYEVLKGSVLGCVMFSVLISYLGME